jgi:hypothetical protein
MRKKTQEEFLQEFNSLSNGEYELLDEYINAITKVRVKHLVCGKEYMVTPNKFLCGRKCPYCKSEVVKIKERISFDEAKDRVNKIYDNKFKLIKYIDTKSECTIECNNCKNKITLLYGNLISRKTTKCSCDKKNRYEKLRLQKEKELIDYCENNGYKLQDNYRLSISHVRVLHKVCNNSWYVLPTNLKRGYGCPYCNQSKLELKTEKELKENNISYSVQYKFDGCKNIFPLPFDFYLSDYNTCIECQGEQHYRSVDLFGGEEGFNRRKINDNIKKEYCNKNNISLIEIKYDEIKNIKKIIKELIKI